jgi:hypothetical protein
VSVVNLGEQFGEGATESGKDVGGIEWATLFHVANIG